MIPSPAPVPSTGGDPFPHGSSCPKVTERPGAIYRRFIDDICRGTGALTRLEAIETAEATLRTLAESVSGAAAMDLASRLPTALAALLQREGWQEGEYLTVPEFVDRAAEREKITPAGARCHVEVVFRALATALGTDSGDVLRGSLPPEYAALWQAPPQEAHMHQPIE